MKKARRNVNLNKIENVLGVCLLVVGLAGSLGFEFATADLACATFDVVVNIGDLIFDLRTNLFF